MSESKNSIHSIDSAYRGVAMTLKEIIPHAYPELQDFNPKVNVNDYIEAKQAQFQDKGHGKLELVIGVALLRLGKAKRTKGNIQNILLQTQTEFRATLHKLRIELRGFDLEQLQFYQAKVRDSLCRKYAQRGDNFYLEKLKEREDFEKLRLFIDRLFMQDKLSWELPDKNGKKKRLNLKKMIDSSHSNIENHWSLQGHSSQNSKSTAAEIHMESQPIELPDLVSQNQIAEFMSLTPKPSIVELGQNEDRPSNLMCFCKDDCCPFNDCHLQENTSRFGASASFQQ